MRRGLGFVCAVMVMSVASMAWGASPADMPELRNWANRITEAMHAYDAGKPYERTLEVVTERDVLRAALTIASADEDVVCEPMNAAADFVTELERIATQLGVASRLADDAALELIERSCVEGLSEFCYSFALF